MTKEEIKEKIYKLKTDDEIMKFIKKRLDELESLSIEKTIGQNYTDSFKDYISEKVHYKAADNFNDGECPDLIYDDITPYIELIKEIKKTNYYSNMTLFTTIFFIIHDYLPSGEFGLARYMTYASHKGKKLSIKTIRDNECAYCSEKAGLSHNMFKFLGIDSEVVCGGRNSEIHAYNFVYPNGYGKEPIVLYDPSHFVNFIKDDRKLSFGFFKALRKEEYERLKNGESMQIDLSKTEKNYRDLYGYDGELDDYIFEDKTPIYIYGLKNAKNYKSSNKHI